MNTKLLIADFAILAATGFVYAQEFVALDTNFVSSRARAEVAAEAAQARADGTLDVKDATYPVTPTAAPGKTRADVRAELAQYLKAHPYGVARLYSGLDRVGTAV